MDPITELFHGVRAERFLARIPRSRKHDCWVWPGATDPCGYGRVVVRPKEYKAHRVAWTLANGPIPEGLEVCHSCDNPPCCNPAHLWLGTHAENMRDRNAKGRGYIQARGTGAWTKLSRSDVQAIRRCYAAGDISQQALADKYGIKQPHVSRIIAGTSW